MDHLFELFVFEWLKMNLDPSLKVHSKQQINISPDGSLKFEIDMVLKDAVTGKIISVLDTKYKHVESPSTDDISQVISYADVTQCNNAVLIYPALLRYPRNEQPGRTRIRTMTFDLSKNLVESGQLLIAELLSLKVQSS